MSGGSLSPAPLTLNSSRNLQQTASTIVPSTTAPATILTTTATITTAVTTTTTVRKSPQFLTN